MGTSHPATLRLLYPRSGLHPAAWPPVSGKDEILSLEIQCISRRAGKIHKKPDQ